MNQEAKIGSLVKYHAGPENLHVLAVVISFETDSFDEDCVKVFTFDKASLDRIELWSWNAVELISS